MNEINKDRIIEDFSANLIRLGNECRDHALENARLKAEVESLKEGNEYLGQMHDKEMERSAYLCEQVERLEKGIQPEGSNDAVGRAVELLLEKEKEIASLKAEVERLTKAGDAMALEFQTYFPLINKMALVDEWNAAKGVQS